MFATLRAQLFHPLADELERIPRQLSPIRSLEALGQAYRHFTRQNPHAYRLLYVIYLHQSRGYQSIELAQKRTQKMLSEAMQPAIDAGEIVGDATLVADTFWASIHALVSLDLSNQVTQGQALTN